MRGQEGNDKAKGGKGKDLFFVEYNSSIHILDFKVNEDSLFIIAPEQMEVSWAISGKNTYLYDDDDNLIAKLKGKHDLSKADLSFDDA